MIIISFFDKKIMKMSAIKCKMRERWAIVLEKKSFGLYRQSKYQNREWVNSSPYYRILFDFSSFNFGRNHKIKENIDDIFSIGFVHFCWQSEDCDECWNKEWPRFAVKSNERK